MNAIFVKTGSKLHKLIETEKHKDKLEVKMNSHLFWEKYVNDYTIASRYTNIKNHFKL